MKWFCVIFLSNCLVFQLFAADIVSKEISISVKYEIKPWNHNNIAVPYHSNVRPFTLPPNLPEKDYILHYDCYYIRPPYSNNTIPLIAKGINEYNYESQKYLLGTSKNFSF
jgi:hypothetical protein